MNTIIVIQTQVDKDEFVRFWSSKYVNPNETLYTDNIGSPLDEDKIFKLFTWKNNNNLSRRKKRTIQEKYIPLISAEIPSEIDRVKRYIQNIRGNAIWNLFWLHCVTQGKYPLYDQHTHRASRYCIVGEVSEIPKNKNIILDYYFEDYIPFYNFFENNDRAVDKALFTFGKYVKQWV
jgi:hypothetical protein